MLLSSSPNVDVPASSRLRLLSTKVRAGTALALVVIAYVIQPFLLRPTYHWLRVHLGLPQSPANNVLYCTPYILLVSLRLAWWAACAALVIQIDRDAIAGLLSRNRRSIVLFMGGLFIGLLVMTGTILAIAAVGKTGVAEAHAPVGYHLRYGAGWMLGEIILASSEELLFRGLIFALVARMVDTRVALVVSALAFVYVHVGNPGATGFWLARLAAAGLLLCYSVIRSRSLWWAIGYHAGWNWASAPLFGVAGSGYMNEGHIFSFTPGGAPWVTGGAVGPEGSVFAFVAVFAATALLVRTVPRHHAS